MDNCRFKIKDKVDVVRKELPTDGQKLWRKEMNKCIGNSYIIWSIMYDSWVPGIRVFLEIPELKTQGGSRPRDVPKDIKGWWFPEETLKSTDQQLKFSFMQEEGN